MSSWRTEIGILVSGPISPNSARRASCVRPKSFAASRLAGGRGVRLGYSHNVLKNFFIREVRFSSGLFEKHIQTVVFNVMEKRLELRAAVVFPVQTISPRCPKAD